jgi:hypothetical protein
MRIDMRGYLLDTNVISEMRKGNRALPQVRRWFESICNEELFISVLVFGELRKGVELLRRKDPVAASHLDTWLSRCQRDFTDRILLVDEIVADVWGKLSVPNPLPVVDGLLAATAMVHHLIFVTRNIRDVEHTGVNTLNPFDST